MSTGSVSQVSLANRALLQAGARTTIAGFPPADQSVEAQACATYWQSTYEQLARTSQWNTFRQQTTLTLLMAAQGTPENPDGTSYPTPPVPYLYAYAYPADCLRLWWIVPSFPVSVGSTTPQTTDSNNSPTWLPNQGQIPYQISNFTSPTGSPEIIILTNQDQAQAVYCINQPNPQTWDSLFQQAFVSSLAAYLVSALNLSIPLGQLNIKAAEIAIAQAKAADGNEGTTAMDHLPDWMAARAGAQGYSWGFFNNGQACWPTEGMFWPVYN